MTDHMDLGLRLRLMSIAEEWERRAVEIEQGIKDLPKRFGSARAYVMTREVLAGKMATYLAAAGDLRTAVAAYDRAHAGGESDDV